MSKVIQNQDKELNKYLDIIIDNSNDVNTIEIRKFACFQVAKIIGTSTRQNINRLFKRTTMFDKISNIAKNIIKLSNNYDLELYIACYGWKMILVLNQLFVKQQNQYLFFLPSISFLLKQNADSYKNDIKKKMKNNYDDANEYILYIKMSTIIFLSDVIESTVDLNTGNNTMLEYLKTKNDYNLIDKLLFNMNSLIKLFRPTFFMINEYFIQPRLYIVDLLCKCRFLYPAYDEKQKVIFKQVTSIIKEEDVLQLNSFNYRESLEKSQISHNTINKMINCCVEVLIDELTDTFDITREIFIEQKKEDLDDSSNEEILLIVNTLKQQGYYIIDNFLTNSNAIDLQRSINMLYEAGEMFSPQQSNRDDLILFLNNYDDNDELSKENDIYGKTNNSFDHVKDSKNYIHSDDKNNNGTLKKVMKMLRTLQFQLGKYIYLTSGCEFQLARFELSKSSTQGFDKHRDDLPVGMVDSIKNKDLIVNQLMLSSSSSTIIRDDTNFNQLVDADEYPRRISATLYGGDSINGKINGGQLRIYKAVVDGIAEGSNNYVDIEAIPGRLVLFLSGSIDHQVLPMYEQNNGKHKKQIRTAMTCWYH